MGGSDIFYIKLSHPTTRDIFSDLLTRCIEGKNFPLRVMHCFLHFRIFHSFRCSYGVLFSVTYPTWWLWFRESVIDFRKLILQLFNNPFVSSSNLFKSPCSSSYYLQIMTCLPLSFQILCFISFSCLIISAGSLLRNGSANTLLPILMGKFLKVSPSGVMFAMGLDTQALKAEAVLFKF